MYQMCDMTFEKNKYKRIHNSLLFLHVRYMQSEKFVFEQITLLLLTIYAHKTQNIGISTIHLNIYRNVKKQVRILRIPGETQYIMIPVS